MHIRIGAEQYDELLGVCIRIGAEQYDKSLGVCIQIYHKLLSRIDIIKLYVEKFYMELNKYRIAGEVSATRELPILNTKTGARYYSKADFEDMIQRHNSAK